MNKPYGFWSNFKYIWGNVWKYDENIVVLALLQIITNILMPICQLIIPFAAIMLLERGVPVKEFILSVVVIGVFCGLIIASAIGLREKNAFQYTPARLDVFFNELLEKRMTLDYELYEKNSTQQVFIKAAMSLSSNRSGVEGFIHSTVGMIISLLIIVIYVIILCHMNFLIALMMILISSINYSIFYKAKKYDESHQEHITEEDVHLNYYSKLGKNVKAGKDIRMYKLQPWLMEYYSRSACNKKSIERKINTLYLSYETISYILQFLRDFICYGYIIKMLIHGIGLSEAFLFMGIMVGFGKAFSDLGEYLSLTLKNHGMVTEFRNFQDIGEKEFKGNEFYDKNVVPDIRFENVSYKYPNSKDFVLRNLSFHIKSGENIALVGLNGAGKTTIVKLICGLYRPTSGSIYVNSVNLENANKEDYWDTISVIFQKNSITEYSLGENVALSESYDVEKVKACLEKAGIYEKNILEENIKLSGGEAQKLMMARALYRQGKILILDEPTASLDAISEHEMYKKYNELCKNRTSIYISHRLASTRFCDKILYLHQGNIVESGSHNELMELNGRYSEMFSVQSQYYGGSEK